MCNIVVDSQGDCFYKVDKVVEHNETRYKIRELLDDTIVGLIYPKLNARDILIKSYKHASAITVRSNRLFMPIWYAYRYKDIYKIAKRNPDINTYCSIVNESRLFNNGISVNHDSILLETVLPNCGVRGVFSTNYLYVRGLIDIMYMIEYILKHKKEFNYVNRNNILEGARLLDKMLSEKYNVRLKEIQKEDLTADNISSKLLSIGRV